MKYNLKTSAKETIKQSAIKLLTNPFRINRRIRQINKKNFLLILNLHKVGKDNGSAYPTFDPEIFNKLIIFLKENFIFTSFSEIKNERENESENKNTDTEKAKVILSFDDGYKDFIEIAHPILLKHGIRANHNIIPNCVNRQRPPINVTLQDYIGNISKKELRKLKIPKYSWNQNLTKYQEGLRLSRHIKNNPHSVQLEIEKYCHEQLGDRLYEFATPMMNRDDILKILNFYDWGAHSFFHSNMGLETDDFFRNDLLACKKWFKDKLGLESYIYAFPNGSFKESNFKLAIHAGFTDLLLVNDNFSHSNQNIHCRFGFHANSEIEMIYKATGSQKKI